VKCIEYAYDSSKSSKRKSNCLLVNIPRKPFSKCYADELTICTKFLMENLQKKKDGFEPLTQDRRLL